MLKRKKATTTPAPRKAKSMPPTSELLRDITATDTELPMLSAAPYEMPARVDVRGEKIRCQAKVVGTGVDWLTGCERGADQRLGGSIPQAHPGGTRVVQDMLGLRDVPYFRRGTPAGEISNSVVLTPFQVFEYTFGKGELTLGRVIRMSLAGTYASSATPGTIQLYVFLDNVEGTNHQQTLNNPLPLVSPANVVGGNWTFDGYLNVITLLGGPALECVGTFTLWADDNSFRDSLYASGAVAGLQPQQLLRIFFGGKRSIAAPTNTMNMTYALLEAVN